MQLYEAFKVVQSHIVISSAVALEGIQFNLQTIIVHDLGADLFKDLIFDNTMCFSKNPKEIINQIENFIPKQMKDEFTIQTSEEQALNQFELISDDSINGTTTHKDAIVAIKSEFPKP